jgi:hypothetical protein
MAATKTLHGSMTSIGCGKGCGMWGIKHWYWDYDLHAEDSAGNKGPSHRDFHTVGGMLDEKGNDFNYFWSKNGKRPIFGPASGASWKPSAKEQDRENNKGNKLKVDPSGKPIYKVRSNYSEACYCGSCPR